MEKDYRDLIGEIGEGNFESRFRNLLDLINKFLKEAEYPADSVLCNERILYHVLLDYYSDIARLKEFHEIKHTKSDKVVAYLIFWILRRKPIQLKQYSSEEKDIFVNERFACAYLLTECLLESQNAQMTDDITDKLDKYIEFILYYFKYRQVNPQVIELVIESFKMGLEFGK